MASPGQEAEDSLVGVRSSLVSSQMVTMFPLRVLGVLFTPQDGGESGRIGSGPLMTSKPSAASRSGRDDWLVALLSPRCRPWDGFCCDSPLDIWRDGEVGDPAVFSPNGIDERWTVFPTGFPG